MRSRHTNKMAPVGHEIPANPPVHDAGEELGKSLLMRTAGIVVQFSVSNTKYVHEKCNTIITCK